MSKFKAINGWTKAKMKRRVRRKNNGEVCGMLMPDLRAYCKYRFKGNACAVGCFIPDEVYHPVMEGHPVEFLLKDKNFNKKFKNMFKALPNVLPLSVRGMTKLQQAHDNLIYDAYTCGNDRESVHDVLCRWIDENVRD